MDDGAIDFPFLDSSRCFWIVTLLVLLFHVRMTFGALTWDFATVKQVISTQLTMGAFLKQEIGDKDRRVEEEIFKLRRQNFAVISKSVAHVALPLFLTFVRVALLEPNLISGAQCAAGLFFYLMHCVVGKELIQLTPERMKSFCYSIHICSLVFMILNATYATDLVSFAAMQPFLATGRIAQLGFLDKSVKIPFDILYALVDIGIFIVVFEVRDSTSISFMLMSELTFTLANIFASCVLELWVRARVVATLQTADAESLVSSFRRMLRGVCDGEVLLDHNFEICGESKCLQHLITTKVSMAGKSFDSLLFEEERKRFAEFIQSSTESCGSSESRLKFWPPVCLRMSFRGSAGIRVAADIYHVPVPGLHGSDKPLHLIAFKEDLELRAQTDAQEDAPPQLLPNLGGDPGSTSSLRSLGPSSSRMGESRSFLPGVPELREMALLVDVNTESQDVVKAHLRFRRRKDEPPESKSSMPSMKKMVVPAEWPNLKAKVAEFADKAFWTPNLPPQDLKLALPIHFPDDRLVLAKQVYLKSITGEESGSKVWIGLTGFSAVSRCASSPHDIREIREIREPGGNSGGPVLGAHGLVVGMACSHLKNASNIGYIIPSQVLEQFISCIETHEDLRVTSCYLGVSSLGIGRVQTLESPALCRRLGLPEGCHSGVRLCSVFPLGSSAGLMQEDDVLLEIDGTEISQDATVPLRDNERIHFGHLITKHVAGRDSVKVKLWRESESLEVDVALRPDRWLVPRIDGYDAAAEYAIIGGLVFIPLSHPWAELKSHDKHWSSSRALIHHYWGEALDQEGRQVVVLSKVLAHPCNVGYHNLSNLILSRFAGQPMRNVAELARAVSRCEEEQLVFNFQRPHGDGGELVVLDRKEAIDAEPEILAQHLIAAPCMVRSDGKGEPRPLDSLQSNEPEAVTVSSS